MIQMLKIKDNVDLRELEKFRFIDYGDIYQNEDMNIIEDISKKTIIGVDKKTRTLYFPYENFQYVDIEKVKMRLKDLVEKVEE